MRPRSNHGAPGTLLVLVLLPLLTGPAPARAATFLLLDVDNPGEGFKDPTPVVPVPGNPGTTRGQQRRNVFHAALDSWGSLIASDVEIRVRARFDLLECDETSGVLGAAAPWDFVRDFPAAPRAGTWYPYALADSLAAADLAPGEPDIVAVFNRAVDEEASCFEGFDWWYGIDAPAPPDTMPLFPVVLHEIAHGLGFTTLVNLTDGSREQGFDDAFMVHLEDHSADLLWTEMNDEDRVASAVDTGDLHWIGLNAIHRGEALMAGVHPTDHVQLYAPDPVEVGSSVSHWDTALLPDELMEPFLTPTFQNLVTPGLLQDLGYRLLEDVEEPCVPDSTTLCIDDQPGDGRFKVEVEFETVQAGGVEGRGRAIPLASLGVTSGGLFWFFSPDNPEMLIKILDGCTVNGHYWVFYSAGTNVRVTTVVTDTFTGRTFIDINPDRTPAPPVQETRAFPCEDDGGEGDGEPQSSPSSWPSSSGP